MTQPAQPAVTPRMPGWMSRYAWLPIPLSLAVIAGLWVADLRSVHESRALMVALSVLCTGLASLCVCLLTAGGFLASGRPGLLMFGCGSLVWGATSLLAAVVIDRVNATVTIHNLGVLAAALCHAVGLIWSQPLARRRLALTSGYAGAALAAAVAAWAALAELTPVFFVQGQGGTAFRQWTLLAATALFAWVAGQMLTRDRKAAGAYYYWYGLGLALVACGLTGVFLLTVQGSLLGWANRLTQYLGSAYLLIAACVAWRDSGIRGFSLAAAVDLLQSHGPRTEPPYRSLARYALHYALTAAAVTACFGFWLLIRAQFGMSQPPFIAFCPVVMLAALLAGFGPGLFATALALAYVAYWIMAPGGQLAVAAPVDRLALVLFGLIGVMLSLFAELYRRTKGKAAAFDQARALLDVTREKEFLTNLLDHAAQPFAIGYPDGRLGRFNRAYEQLTGYTAAELRALDWSTVLTPPEWRDAECRHLLELQRTGKPARYQKEYIRKDGSRVPIELLVHLARDAAGRPEYYYSFVTDITERKRLEEERSQITAELERRVKEQTAEIRQANESLEARAAERSAALEAANRKLSDARVAALGLMEDAIIARREEAHNAEAVKRSEALLRSITDNTEDIIFVKDAESRMLFINPAAARAFGRAPDDILGKTDAEWHHDAAQAESFMAADRRIIASGQTESVEESFASPKGPCIFHTTKAPRLDASGSVTGIVGIARDVTERKQAEAALRESEERVRRKLESVLAPDGDLGVLELADLVDAQALQRLMDDLYPLTRTPMAITDLKRRVLVKVGWQDVCTLFHKVHPEAKQLCEASDISLAADLAEGETRLEKCRNNLWHMATPIFAAGQRVGTILTGQFLFDDEALDRDGFRDQARRFGFDEQLYLGLLDRIPRFSRADIERSMAFFLRLADMVSQLGYSNAKLARLLAERDRLTDTLRQSESFYRQTLESIPGMTFTTRPDGYCDYQSQQWVDFTGVPMQKHLGDGWNKLLHPDDRPRAYAAWYAAVEGRAPYNLEYRVRGSDGSYEWFKVCARPIRNAAGEIVRWFGTAVNIDGLVQAQTTVRQLNEQLEKRVRERTSELEGANRELEAFCYSVSHDLRTPLRSVDGFSQAVLEDYGDKLDKTGRDYLSRVRNGCQQMDQLIDDLLNLSRLTRYQMCWEPVNLTALANTALAPLRESEPEREVRVRIAPGLTAFGDARLLQAAFANLLANAWKFTAQEPSPAIDVARAENSAFPDVDPQTPIFFVRDNGVGFDMQYSGKLFAAFQRLHSSSEFPGTGIGLAIVARVIQRHGGRVWADAAVGCGATFYFTLGSSPAAAGAPEHAQAPHE